MTKFCENCPMRNQAVGEVAGIVSAEYTYEIRAVMGKGALLDQFNVLAGVLADENDRPSMPMKFPGHNPTAARERYIEKIDSCNGPVIEERGLIRKKKICNRLSSSRICCHRRSNSRSNLKCSSHRTDLVKVAKYGR